MSRDSSLTAPESKKLTKRLKMEDPEQFQTLVRMHLSFVLDLNIDDTDGNTEKSKFRALKWGFPPFSKKQRCPQGGASAAATPTAESSQTSTAPVHLTQEIISQVFQLIEFLSKEENLVQEGIFRRSGKVTRQQELKSQLSRGVSLQLEDGPFSVHDCASVLKSFLAELPEPLLMEVYYPAYCQIAELCQTECSRGRVLHAVQLVLLLLPRENRRLLKELLRLLSLTASLAHSNRMSAENLATLFTPHLLCPRKLSPEAFHVSSQNFTCVVVFMIKEGLEVFEVPQTLATDIKAYWDRRRLTPNHLLERSMTEGSSTAKTVFSFVDHERTAQEHSDNPTETALAQLYAHIQGLPESSKKKRLIKQFNKENGHGTPRTKTLSDSIKKHIFHKSHKEKAFMDTGPLKLFGSSGDNVFNSPQVYKTPMSHLRYNERREDWRSIGSGRRPMMAGPVMKASLGGVGAERTAASPMPPPDPQLQGTVVTPPPSISPPDVFYTPLCGGDNRQPRGSCSGWPHTTDAATTPCRPSDASRVSENLPSQLTPSPLLEAQSIPSRHDLVHTRGTLLTSTPAPTATTSSVSQLLVPTTAPTTPLLQPPDDMSPITRSAQRMPKAMQEAMVTPRSRKPVVALSGSNLCHLSSTNWTLKELSWGESAATTGPNRKALVTYPSQEEGDSEEEVGGSEGGESLTSPFKDYLFSRSVLTASPVDLSFSSRTGDFDPWSSDDRPLSESLLYCLDKASPPPQPPTQLQFSATSSGFRRTRRRHSQDSVQPPHKKSSLDHDSNSEHIFVPETSL